MKLDRKLQWEHPDLNDGDGTAHAQQAMEIETAKHVGKVLEAHYAGHPWHVSCELTAKGGVVKIRIEHVMPPDYCYVLHFTDVFHDPSNRLIIKAGGELLERYKLPRNRFSDSDWMSAMNNVKIIGRGNRAPLL